MARLLAVAETSRLPRHRAPGAQWLVESYVNPAKANAVAMVTSRHDQRGGTLDPVETYLDGIIIHGTPERVLDQLQQLHEEIWLDYLLCAPLSHSSFLMFTEKVLPRVCSDGADLPHGNVLGSVPPERLHYETAPEAGSQRQCKRRNDHGIWFWTTDTRANGCTARASPRWRVRARSWALPLSV